MIADLLVIVLGICVFAFGSLVYHLHTNRSPWGNWFWLVIFRRRVSCPQCQSGGCPYCDQTGRIWEAIPTDNHPTDNHGKPVVFGNRHDTEPLASGLIQPPEPTFPLGIPPFDEQGETPWYRQNRK